MRLQPVLLEYLPDLRRLWRLDDNNSLLERKKNFSCTCVGDVDYLLLLPLHLPLIVVCFALRRQVTARGKSYKKKGVILGLGDSPAEAHGDGAGGHLGEAGGEDNGGRDGGAGQTGGESEGYCKPIGDSNDHVSHHLSRSEVLLAVVLQELLPSRFSALVGARHLCHRALSCELGVPFS